MDYFKLLIDGRVEEREKMNTRPTVRGLAFRDDKMLMVRTNRGDYKIPGGGVGRRESFEQALVREMREETGYKCVEIGEKIGEIEEVKNDIFDEAADFCMHSHYYLIQVSSECGSQKLDAYEAKLGFKPCWISIEGALAFNHKVLESNEDIPWLEREIKILETIRDYYKS